MSHIYDDPTAKQFAAFAEVVRNEHPFYAHLSDAITSDRELLDLAGLAMAGQPLPNVLFAAVQYLLLGGVRHALADWYPEVSGSDSPRQNPFPAFRNFCLEHRDALEPLVRSRRTQTNEVARCLALLPAIGEIARRDPRPLSLIEIGASAGLLLTFDRYHYTYGDQSWGPARSLVRLAAELRGGQPPIPSALAIADRVGVDLNPLDVTNERDVRWLDSLVWPGQTERRERLRQAVETAAANPPRVIQGDALEMLVALISSVAGDSLPVVFHSFALNQWTFAQRAELGSLLRASGRPVARIWFEWFGYQRNLPAIKLYDYRDGKEQVETLGRSHHHGQWLDWGWSEPSTNS